MKKFNFDYDYENDSLFLYSPKSKSKASIEIDDLIIDYNSKKEVSAIELLNASKFLKDIVKNISKKDLNNISRCMLEFKPKGNFLLIKFMLKFNSKKEILTPIIIPNIYERSSVAVT